MAPASRRIRARAGTSDYDYPFRARSESEEQLATAPRSARFRPRSGLRRVPSPSRFEDPSAGDARGRNGRQVVSRKSKRIPPRHKRSRVPQNGAPRLSANRGRQKNCFPTQTLCSTSVTRRPSENSSRRQATTVQINPDTPPTTPPPGSPHLPRLNPAFRKHPGERVILLRLLSRMRLRRGAKCASSLHRCTRC